MQPTVPATDDEQQGDRPASEQRPDEDRHRGVVVRGRRTARVRREAVVTGRSAHDDQRSGGEHERDDGDDPAGESAVGTRHRHRIDRDASAVQLALPDW